MLSKCVLGALCWICVVGATAEPFRPLEPKIKENFLPDKTELEAGLWMQMEQIEKDARTSPARIRDADLNRYLHDIVCRLSQDYCKDMRVYVMRSPYFNAFMAPNGMMVVWTGLLLRVHNEAQLATVLGHEMGHYLRRHSLDRFKRVKFTANLSRVLSIGLRIAAATSTAQNVGITFALFASLFSYTRSQESEADKFGIQLLSNAGYDPFEASRVWENVIGENNVAQGNKRQRTLFFDTHPGNKDRMKTLNRYARNLTENGQSGAEKGRERFIKHMDPFWKMALEDELNLNQFGRTEFILDNLIANNISPGVTHFYKGELYRARKEEGDLAQARWHYEQALEFDSFLPETHRSLGLLQLKEKQHAQAMRNFEAYLRLAPEAEDREMIEFYLAMEQ